MIGAANGRLQRVSLRARVTLLAAFCVAGAVAVVSLGAYMTVSQNLHDQMDENLRQRAQAAVNAPKVNNDVTEIPGAFLAAGDIRIGVLDVTGQILYPKGTVAPPTQPADLDVARGSRLENIWTDLRTDFRVIAVPYGDGQAMLIAQSTKPLNVTLGKLSVVLFVISGLGVLVAAVAGTAVARTGLRPVQRLTEATERVALTGDLRPIPVSGDDELALLSQRFNAMLGAVADSQERQRRLVADAGHELRTPLTSMRTNLELLLASERPDAPTLSDEDKAEINADVRAQLDELTTLIGDLVELAREDAPQVVHEPVDLVEVVERALDRAKRRATDVDFVVEVQPWSLLGDSSALERAVLNLLDNAVKFSPARGVVRLSLKQLGDGSAVVEVADSGPGIADGDLPHVFERFYRSSEARTLPGSGLGLAIVKQVAERHGGLAYVGRAPEGGAMFTIRLPGRPAPVPHH
ncbi:HAMP domain-containing histidine kinase [Saccharothrix sp. 6-C]|uniref:Signal transduction histidine-protein kinase/phosphatase MprB n=1 Tax=Saccharothrix texasensis TaxID=103734 RepID=A0A3N1H7U0_9PSEU|nr:MULTISPECIES: HAMP domain-containing sensor histidine kinase [Saccharothrix]QQQ77042.1 HAMP domain-containing histidine kinase [Saccharothrix sp. 6-C]ROP38615.1 two-component system sensor histidine kinase MprB [Saccharothrix texasensis]